MFIFIFILLKYQRLSLGRTNEEGLSVGDGNFLSHKARDGKWVGRKEKNPDYRMSYRCCFVSGVRVYFAAISDWHLDGSLNNALQNES